MINPAEVFQLVVALLNEVETNDPLPPESYSPDQIDIHLKHGYGHLHAKSLNAVKHLYCQFNHELNAYYELNKDALNVSSSGACKMFEKLKKDIDGEMASELEKQLLDSDSN